MTITTTSFGAFACAAGRAAAVRADAGAGAGAAGAACAVGSHRAAQAIRVSGVFSAVFKDIFCQGAVMRAVSRSGCR